jgi:hypothetical protein
MIAIGRALMAKSTLILLVEPSMGLAPQIVEEIFEIVRGLNRNLGTSFLLAEQNAALALQYADHGFSRRERTDPESRRCGGTAAETGHQSVVFGWRSGGGRGQSGERGSRVCFGWVVVGAVGSGHAVEPGLSAGPRTSVTATPPACDSAAVRSKTDVGWRCTNASLEVTRRVEFDRAKLGRSATRAKSRRVLPRKFKFQPSESKF